jgi:hypothetical protein
MPPYGANIASAGLLLGVYVASRIEKLMVLHNGTQYAVNQWLQDEIFRGKFLDLLHLQGDELVLIGGESEEWEMLLEEWDLADSYFERASYLRRARALRERLPVPPMLGYRFEHLREQADQALAALQKIEEEEQNAMTRLENGYEHSDVSMLSWGAASLHQMVDSMAAQHPLWTNHQIEEIQPHIERARQTIIQILPHWLSRQVPIGDRPDNVGEFKHKMLHLIGGNLKKLHLDDQYQSLEDRVLFLVRNVETAAEARQLVRDTSSWLDQHADALRIVRIAEVRGLREFGRNQASKLQGMAQRIDMPEINDIRTRLPHFFRCSRMPKRRLSNELLPYGSPSCGPGRKSRYC